MRAPKPHEQAAIFGASYALMILALRFRDRLLRRRAGQSAETERARLLRLPDGTAFIGSADWIAGARARYGADNPAAN